VIELHGNIHGVVCLDCRALYPRTRIQAWLAQANPALVATGPVGEVVPEARPDGDAELELDEFQDFHLPHCDACGGTLAARRHFLRRQYSAPAHRRGA
jgi:NAD-dependent SIR2 family protein deacetylase